MAADSAAADTLISARWVVPVQPAGTVIEGGAVVVRDGRILAVGDAESLRAAHPGARRIERGEHLLIPGFVNAHTHAGMALMRGYADDMPLAAWLNDAIWPGEKRWVDESYVRDGTRLALCEMVRGGTTCMNDMYFHPDAIATCAAEFGVRARVGIVVIDFPTSWASDANDALSKGLSLRDEYRGHPSIGFTFAPHSTYAAGDDPLKRIRKLSDQLEEPVHIHVHETRAEIQSSLRDHGVRPLARLHEYGLVTPSLIAVHLTQVDEDDFGMLAQGGANVVHCPQSNLKLASGMAPVAEFVERGINVALGTDGAASNNRLDMISEMHTAALLAKAVSGSASSVSAQQVLEMATLGGARALGWGDSTGSLTPGKWADIACIDLSPCTTAPVYDPVSALVYAAGREQVSDVWVAGRALVSEGELIAADEAAIVERARRWGTNMAPGRPAAARARS